ncbi:MAG: hypothetical protein ACT4NY_13395 [Pseudonocardiales bacterium]
MTALEGPAAGWLLTKLGPIGRWLKRHVARDHRPITGRQGRPDQYYGAFYVFVAVAPSKSPKPLLPIDFADRARELIDGAFPGDFPSEPDYSGRELVRYRHAIEGAQSPAHQITIYPTGLVELQWIIAAPPATALPLADAVAAVGRLHRAVQSSMFPNLHQRRWFARWRHVDWRIGINGFAVLPTGSSVGWTDIVTPDPRPSCPSTGYAADRLVSSRRGTKLDSILTPVMEELLNSGGYIDSAEIRECVADLLAAPSASRELVG